MFSFDVILVLIALTRFDFLFGVGDFNSLPSRISDYDFIAVGLLILDLLLSVLVVISLWL